MTIVKALRAAVAGAFLCGGVAAGAGSPTILSRTAPWQVDFDQDSCHLIGQFGRGPDQVLLRLTRSNIPVAFQMTLAGERLKVNEPNVASTLDFGLGTEPVPLSLQAGRTGSGLPVLQSVGTVGLRVLTLPPTKTLDVGKIQEWAALQESTARDDFARISHIVVTPNDMEPFRLETGSLGKPLQMVDQCIDNLVRTWGYDPNIVRSLSKGPMPVGSPAGWMKSEDYPRMQSYLNERAIVRFRLDITEAGQVSGCKILHPRRNSDFDRITCEKLRLRARFVPALDASGKPVRSFWQSQAFFAGQAERKKGRRR